MENLGHYFVENIEFVKHLLLKKEAERGGRFTPEELHNLHDCCKSHYMAEILAYDENV
jgi:hypothetical protein